MAEQVTRFLVDSGVTDADIKFELSALMSYVGQGYEVEVDIPDAAIESTDSAAVRAAFERRYATLYGRLNDEFEIQVITWRMRGSGPKPLVVTDKAPEAAPGAHSQPRAMRKVYDAETDAAREWPVFHRFSLSAGSSVAGPCIIDEREATVVVPSGAMATLDASMNLVVVLAPDS
jgi:N-methylhydantoinase A/oxoprolinase/acetone carboxylase beta subunit